MSSTNRLGRPLAVALLCSLCVAGTALAAGRARDAQRLEVFKPDGSLQCEPDSGTPASAMAAELQAAGVQVYGARRTSDGMMHMQLCGSSTGRINVLEIDGADLEQARGLGFRPFEEPQ